MSQPSEAEIEAIVMALARGMGRLGKTFTEQYVEAAVKEYHGVAILHATWGLVLKGERHIAVEDGDVSFAGAKGGPADPATRTDRN